MIKQHVTLLQTCSQIIQLVGNIFHLFFDIWNQASLYQKLIFLDALLAIFVFIYSTIFSPLLFKIYIIPKIEKKIGHKLENDAYSYYYKIPLTWGRDIEISQYIINRYRAFKKYNDTGLPKGLNTAPLKRAGYTINMMSKSEIFFSLMVNFNCAVTLFVLVASPILFLIVPAIKGLFFH